MRRQRRVMVGGAALVVALFAGAGVAASQVGPVSGSGSAVANRLAGYWRAAPVSTSSSAFAAVPSLRAKVCAIGEVAVTVSVMGSGAPMALQVHQDYGPTLHPGAILFAPGPGAQSASFTFLARVAPFEANDHHEFQVEWRAPMGGTATIQSATMSLTYQQGTHAC